MSILGDLFPETTVPEFKNITLMKRLKTICQIYGFVEKDTFLEKCIHFYETSKVRHGIILVGEAASAKSAVMNTVRKAIIL